MSDEPLVCRGVGIQNLRVSEVKVCWHVWIRRTTN
jgi:hypothetical protein